MKLKSAVLGVLLVLASAGCTSAEPVAGGNYDRAGRYVPDVLFSEQSRYIVRGAYGSSVRMFIDPETGCHYLIYSGGYSGGMTMRMGADGKQMCAPDDIEAVMDSNTHRK